MSLAIFFGYPDSSVWSRGWPVIPKCSYLWSQSSFQTFVWQTRLWDQRSARVMDRAAGAIQDSGQGLGDRKDAETAFHPRDSSLAGDVWRSYRCVPATTGVPEITVPVAREPDRLGCRQAGDRQDDRSEARHNGHALAVRHSGDPDQGTLSNRGDGPDQDGDSGDVLGPALDLDLERLSSLQLRPRSVRQPTSTGR